MPARPLAVFLYMYVIRLGMLDGRAGLRFCFFHAWYQATVDALAAEAPAGRRVPAAVGHPVAGASACPSRDTGQQQPPRRAAAPPRLGVLATHPIQYQAPLYQELARRGRVDLEVAFLSHDGARPYHDPSFGVTLAWDIDLLSGYPLDPAWRAGRWRARRPG